MPLFPTVPNAPGVPPVARLPGVPIPSAPILLAADAISVVSAFLTQDWGIFLNGVQVVGQDVGNFFINLSGIGSGNFLEMAFRLGFDISKYPQEAGAFQNYNKVQKPYDVATTVTAGGSALNRAALLQQVQAIIATTDLYTVVMPEGPIDGLNPVGYALERRHDRGLGLLMIEIFWEQVRPAGDPTFSTTATPTSTAAAAATTGGAAPITNPMPAFASATSQSSQGVVSPTIAPPAVSSAVAGKL
jgi:hypothetical protein